MGFVVLLLLGLCAGLRVEAGAGAVALRTLAVRESVRLGLMMALGRLQEAAGADRRVTAGAAFAGPAGAGRSGWCGVWDTRRPGDEPRWLVAGPTGEGSAAVVGSWRLSPPGWPERFEAWVPVMEVFAEGGRPEVRLAWWISDEGVKASLGKHGDPDTLAGWPGLPSASGEVMRTSTPQRFRHTAPPGDGSGGGLLAPDVSALAAIWAGTLAPPPPLEVAEVLDEFPAGLTWTSLGVLSDTAAGGLRRDLSHPSTSGGGGFGDAGAVRALLSRWPGDGEAHPVAGHPEDAPADGAPGLAAPLLMHEFCLYVGVFREKVGASTPLKAHLTVRAEIWNPHSVPLAMTPKGEPDLRVSVRGLPVFEAEWETGAGAVAGRFQFDAGALEMRADADGRVMGTLAGDGLPIDVHDDFTSADTRLKAVRGHASLGVSVPDGTPGGDDFIALRAGPAELDIELRTAAGELLQRIEKVPFEGFSSAAVRLQQLLPVYGSRSPAYGDHQALFHLRLLDGVVRTEAGKAAPMEEWFSRYDPRAARIDLSGEGDPGWRALFEVDANPGENVALQTNFFIGDPELLNGGNFVRAFDLPLAPVVSIGWLQHLYFHGRRPFSVGNPWGGPLNRAFDAFFLSGFPFGVGEDAAPETMTALPNPHLRFVRGARGEDLAAAVLSEELARDVLVSGAFNIHSTSEEAWAALLRSLRLDGWSFRHGYGVPEIERPGLVNGVFRFPQGARGHYKSPFLDYPAYPEVSQEEKAAWYKTRPGEPDWLYAFDTGLRELRERDVDALAGAVVDLLRARARPFVSLSEFVDSGLLQEAIDRTEINSVASGAEATYDRQDPVGDAAVFPEYCPSFLTQADLLSTFAPLLSARSDSFVIRVRAEVSPAGGSGPAVAAGCEAWVQRLTEAVDPEVPEKGRRFKILSIRWLDGNGT